LFLIHINVWMRVKSQLREGSFREEGGVYMYSCQQKKIKTYKTMPTPQQINQTIHRPTNQNEYNLLIKSIPFSLVEIYASWCGPSRIFKVDAQFLDVDGSLLIDPLQVPPHHHLQLKTLKAKKA